MWGLIQDRTNQWDEIVHDMHGDAFGQQYVTCSPTMVFEEYHLSEDNNFLNGKIIFE